MIDIEELYDKHQDEYCQFDRVENKTSKRPDLHAFMLLDRLVPADSDNTDIVSAAEHDQIWLEVEPEALAEVATEEQIVELIRCGVRYTDGGFCMHV